MITERLIEQLTKIDDLLEEACCIIVDIEYESPEYEHINHIKETIHNLQDDIEFEILGNKESEND